MTADEKIVLSAWANGLGGINPRIAKRAWLVLAHEVRLSPAELAGVWSNAVEAQRWVKNFYAMGLVGLLDAPRSGRPERHESAVVSATEKLDLLRIARRNKASVVADTVLDSLSKQEKESLWRSMRLQGKNPLRKRHGLDLPVAVPDGLRDLACVLLTPRLKVLAFMGESWRHWDTLDGTWISVPQARLAGGVKGREVHDVLSAMRLDVGRAKDLKSKERSAASVRRDTLLINRATGHLQELAIRFPGAVDLLAFTDLKYPVPLMSLMQRMRECGLWQKATQASQGRLKSACIAPYRDSWAPAAQMAIASHLSQSPADLIGELQDVLSIQRRASFCWLKSLDQRETDEEAGWGHSGSDAPMSDDDGDGGGE